MSVTLESHQQKEKQIKPWFRVILSRHKNSPDWQIVSNPQWDYCTKAQSAILENSANDYAEYENCGCVYRMIRAGNLNDYDLAIKDESSALNPGPC